jgi:thiamine-phosphate pyrophosphorylase
MIYLRPYHFINNYNKKEMENLNNKINIIYRNYRGPINESVIIKIKSECQKLGIKLFLSNNIKMAIKLKLNGVYIPSFNKSLNLKFKTNKQFQMLGSAHNLKEIRIKEKQGIDTIFLSPIFKINKKKHYFDIYKFKELSKLTKKKVVALGGINEKNIKRIKLLNCDGFAAIKYFKKIKQIK